MIANKIKSKRYRETYLMWFNAPEIGQTGITLISQMNIPKTQTPRNLPQSQQLLQTDKKD